MLLDKTALRAFRMFPEEDRHNLEQTKEALKSRFKSTEMELRGMEFHHKMQTTESVEELGLELQTLANKDDFEFRWGKCNEHSIILLQYYL